MERHTHGARWVLAAGLLTALTVVLCLALARFPGLPTRSALAQELPAGEAPALQVKITGPEKAAVASKVTFELAVTNVGKAPVSKLLVVDRFQTGLEHAVATSPIEHDLTDLAPGQTQRISLTFRVTQAGALGHVAEVSSAGRVLATAEAKLLAVDTAAKPAAESAAEPRALGSAAKPAPDPQRAEPSKVPAKVEPKPAPSSAFPEIPFRETPAEPEIDKTPDLGPPLVENAAALKRLHPQYPVWVDRPNRRVVLQGGVCLRQSPLELFACLRGSKEHESILSVPVKASFVHAALLAVGAEPGAPAQFRPTYVPAHGSEIDITLVWKDEKGAQQTAPAQNWIRNAATRKPMEHPWVFAGSRFVSNPATGKVVYAADQEGSLICVSNFGDALLDLPIPSSAANEELLFEAFTEHIPAIGTPVTMLLVPRAPPAEKAGSKTAPPVPAEKSAEKAAVKPAEKAAVKPEEKPAEKTSPKDESGEPPRTTSPVPAKTPPSAPAANQAEPSVPAKKPA